MSAQKTSNTTYARAQSRRRNWLSRHTVIGGILLTGIVLLVGTQFGEAGLATWLQLRSAETELDGDVRQLETENASLEADLDAVRNDPEALERLAREEHNMQRPDEEVLTVLPADFASPAEPD